MQTQTILERSPSFKLEYDKWCRGLGLSRINHIREIFEREFFWDKPSNHILILESPGANGIAFYPSEDLPGSELQFLMEVLKDRIVAKGYQLNLGDVRTRKTGEVITRYYLKPPFLLTADEKIDHAFGNILIELESKSRENTQLKLLQTSYTDHRYSESKTFAELISLFLSEDQSDKSGE